MKSIISNKKNMWMIIFVAIGLSYVLISSLIPNKETETVVKTEPEEDIVKPVEDTAFTLENFENIITIEEETEENPAHRLMDVQAILGDPVAKGKNEEDQYVAVFEHMSPDYRISRITLHLEESTDLIIAKQGENLAK